MSNWLSPEKTQHVLECLRAGMSVRSSLATTGVAKATILRIRKEVALPLCGWGQKVGHRGWCCFLYGRSPRRQALMRKLNPAVRHQVFNAGLLAEWTAYARSQAGDDHASLAPLVVLLAAMHHESMSPQVLSQATQYDLATVTKWCARLRQQSVWTAEGKWLVDEGFGTNEQLSQVMLVMWALVMEGTVNYDPQRSMYSVSK